MNSESSGISEVSSPTIGSQVGNKRSAFFGSCKHQLWQAIRASSAAPYYLDDFSDGTALSNIVGLELVVFSCFIFYCVLDIYLFSSSFSQHFIRCQPLARWCNSGKQSYNFCHKGSTTSLA